MTASLLDRVRDVLEQAHVPYALIGAGALAVYGVSRSTFDQDLLTTDGRVLAADFWSSLRDATVDVRVGDAGDPLAGVARAAQAGERDVDVVVGRHGWQRDVVGRARSHGSLPVVTLEDLILLKLYAGGVQDLWDVDQLLAVHDSASLREHIEHGLAALPPECREVWSRRAR